MIVATFFYYQNEKTLYIDLASSNLQNIASKASNEVIVSHMMNGFFDKEKYLDSTQFKISFYNKDKEFMYGTLEDSIDFSQNRYFKEDRLFIVDSSTVGHLGIWYIALKDNSLKKEINNLKLDIFFIFFIFYFFVSFIGWYLARLFLKPIKDEQNRLNNFIKDTSHELNTPITALIMSCQGETLSAKQIERVKLSAKRVSDIYRDLSFLFLEERNIKECEEIDLKAIIEEEILNFEPLYSRKRLKIELNLEYFSYKIVKDDFIRLFSNLFSNAIKYNKQDGKIIVSLKNGVLFIEDSGIGIEKNKFEDIFKRYYRATDFTGGFGLGLNIVYTICKMYNIKIDIDSQIDIGTLFTIDFIKIDK